MKYSLVLFFALGSLATQATENDTLPKVDVENEQITQETNYYLNHLDSFVINAYYGQVINWEEARKKSDSISAEIIIPENRAEEYAKRLQDLDAQTPFELRYNKHVRAFIDLYLFKRRDLTENCLGLSEYYFPIFEEALDKYNLPIEFKYLAIVESALNVKARSRAGAAGLWQFMYRTGKYYDLKIDSYIDERYEIYSATDAACRYFADLYKTYNNWELVIAAYNCGPGNVNKAIRRSGGKRNYWDIRSYLPRETRGYVPAFIAVNYAMVYGVEYGLEANYPDSLNLLTDTIGIQGEFDLKRLSTFFCANEMQLDYLNPSFKKGIVPNDGRTHTLRLPIGLMNAYLSFKTPFDLYFETMGKEDLEAIKNQKKRTNNGIRHVHVVESGEVLGLIAEKYGCGLSQVKDWNGLYSSRIYEGQQLVLYLDKPAKETIQTVKATKRATPVHNDRYTYHVIKPGDTLWDIAKLYNGLTVTELKRLNSGVNYKKLKPGDKLIVSSNT